MTTQEAIHQLTNAEAPRGVSGLLPTWPINKLWQAVDYWRARLKAIDRCEVIPDDVAQKEKDMACYWLHAAFRALREKGIHGPENIV